MNRHRNIIAERVVIQHIDAEKQHDIDQPSSNGHLVRPYKERWSTLVELGYVSSYSHEDELDKGQKGSFFSLSGRSQVRRRFSQVISIPASGSTLRHPLAKSMSVENKIKLT